MITSIRIPRNYLKIISVLTLLVPSFIFLAAWLRWYIGIPLCGCLLAAFILYLKQQLHSKKSNTIFGERDNTFTISLPSLICCILVAVVWAYLSGIGGRFTQSNDFHGRNAIMHDLLNHSWPVYFDNDQGALTYYIGFWLIPALLGKFFGLFFGPVYAWKFANGFLLMQTVWFLFLIFLLMLSLLNRRTYALPILLLFVMFSGMDGLMCFLKNDWSTHLEYWASDWQYSSITTCLFWVFNQSVPAWLCTLLCINSIDEVWFYGLFGSALALFAPFPLVGFFILCACCFLVFFFRCKDKTEKILILKNTLSGCNLLSIASIIPVLLYLRTNASVSDSAFHIELFAYKYSFPQLILAHLLFAVIEWGFYAAMLFPRYRKEPVFIIVCVSLIAFPWFKAGKFYNDLPMRASIPALQILMLYCAHDFINWEKNHRMGPVFVLAGLLALGTLTPLTEFKRGIDEFNENLQRPVIRDDYKTVLSEMANTDNFVCRDPDESFFFSKLAKPEAKG